MSRWLTGDYCQRLVARTPGGQGASDGTTWSQLSETWRSKECCDPSCGPNCQLMKCKEFTCVMMINCDCLLSEPAPIHVGLVTLIKLKQRIMIVLWLLANKKKVRNSSVYLFA
ncbi:hypothetical protein B5X24_HaOG208657 [Helicoverpa armigera]|uniref:Uncharacterized protein n=1 Tax=Helicoverpa armigera TaxID=29058 RepID=A0A2W1BM19_HELAM|nr:hypothetical protein B5X24_HaOG208657 [Helicoverpa armigera]